MRRWIWGRKWRTNAVIVQIWETPYGYTDDSFPCSIDRTSDKQSTADHMYMINHSLNKHIGDIKYSDPEDAPTTNGVDSYVFVGCLPVLA